MNETLAERVAASFNALNRKIAKQGDELAAARARIDEYKIIDAAGAKLVRSLSDENLKLQARLAGTPAIPEGFRLVPVEPTDEMLEAASNVFRNGGGTVIEAYRAILSASPTSAEGDE